MGKGSSNKVLLNLLRTSTIEVEKLEIFTSIFTNYRGSPEEFWQILFKKVRFNTEELEELKYTVELSVITKNHLPLIRELQITKREGKVKSAKDLLKLSKADWLALINRTNASCPSEITGENEEEKRNSYAEYMERMLKLSFPTQIIADIIGDHGTLDRSDVDKFLSDKSKQDVILEVKKLQRVFKVTPSNDEIAQLISQEFTSAYDISSMPAQESKEAYKKPEIQE